jgi:hypothetical protein
MKKTFLIAVAALLLAGCSRQTVTPDTTPEPDSSMMQDAPDTTLDDPNMMTENESIVISLAEQSSSGQTGTASLEEVDGKVIVSLTMVGTPSTVAQPAHIHVGSCPTPGAVQYPLTDVVDGSSITTLDVTLDEIRGQLPLAINVHKSSAEANVYTSCGDIQ